MKVCSKCKIEKDESEFGKHKTMFSGLRSSCKECHNQGNKKYRENLKPMERLNNMNTTEKQLINKIFNESYDIQFNQNGKYVYTCDDLNLLFETKSWRFFEKEYMPGGTQEPNAIIYNNKQRGKPYYFTLKEAYDYVVFYENHTRDFNGYATIKEDCKRVLSNPVMQQFINLNEKQEKIETQQPKQNNERVFLYHFMKDYGRFPNEEEEVEYQKSFTEKEVEKMVEVYQKSLKKTKRS